MSDKPNSKVVLGVDNFKAKATSRDFNYCIDTPIKKGGSGTGPTPVEYFLAAIAACVAITLRSYADKMKWDLGEITVVAREETRLTPIGIVKTIFEEISVEKSVSEEQLASLNEKASTCPVAQMVKNQTKITRTIEN